MSLAKRVNPFQGAEGIPHVQGEQGAVRPHGGGGTDLGHLEGGAPLLPPPNWRSPAPMRSSKVHPFVQQPNTNFKSASP